MSSTVDTDVSNRIASMVGQQVWTREHGPHASLGWLEGGRLTETIPEWFVDFFASTRDLRPIGPGSADNCTMTTVEDNWCLYRLAQLAKPARSLEIGVMRGSSSITIGRAYKDAGIECDQIALDIDPEATAAAARHLRRLQLSSSYHPVVGDSRQWVRASDLSWQFVFLDGDHAYDTVALEFAETWNRTDVGGWIILHDTGSPLWGTNEDPGVLFFGPLDLELGDSAEMTWLDSTECNIDMKLRTTMGLHVTLPPICGAIAVGYGGMGIVRKLDDRVRLSAEQLLRHRPSERPTYLQTVPVPPAQRIIRRILSAVRR